MNPEFNLSVPALSTSANLRLRIEQVARFTADPHAMEVLNSGTINPLQAVVLRAIIATPGLPHFLYERTVAPDYRRAGFNILGVGTQAVTVSDGAYGVRKFYRHTAGKSESFQEETMRVWNARQTITQEYLGRYTVPHVFSIEQNPLNKAESIVTATQERIDPSGALNRRLPGAFPEAAVPFLRDSQYMRHHSKPSAVPDLVGKNNALIEANTGAIKLIDPISIIGNDSNDKKNYDIVAQFLDEFNKTD